MKNNFRTLTSAILTKTSALFAKKDEVYTKEEAASKADLTALTPSDVGAASAKHDHSYLQCRNRHVALPSRTLWSSIAYGDGKFVAVAENGDKAAYSKDGITWIETTLPLSTNWYSVTYGNGVFVAVGEGDIAAYSNNGITWSQALAPGYAIWSSVTYGNDRFVAVSTDRSNGAMYSLTGKDWYPMGDLPSRESWSSVTYGDDKFVAMAQKTNTAAYSENGLDWVAITLPGSKPWVTSVTYGNGRFVAVPNRSDKALYSEDGVNWSETTLPASPMWNCVTYDNGRFIAIAFVSDKTAYSYDGITWFESAMPSSQDWYSVTYGDGKFVAIIRGLDKAAYSYDGLTWYNIYEDIVQDGEVVDLIGNGSIALSPVAKSGDYCDLKNVIIGDRLVYRNLTISPQISRYLQLPENYIFEEKDYASSVTYKYGSSDQLYEAEASWTYGGRSALGGLSYRWNNVNLYIYDDGSYHMNPSTSNIVELTISFGEILYKEPIKLPQRYFPDAVDCFVLNSSTADSGKKFNLTVDDSGTIVNTSDSEVVVMATTSYVDSLITGAMEASY